MLSFVYNKGAEYYDLYEYYNLYDPYDDKNDNDNDNDINSLQQIKLIKTDSRLCSICLEGTMIEPFYDYDIDNITHNCYCKPCIHIKCFYQCLKQKKKCVICGTSIDQKLTNIEKFIIRLNYTVVYLLRLFIGGMISIIFYKIISSIFFYYTDEEL